MLYGVTIGLGFLSAGTFYSNNSMVTLSAIRQGLYCLTNNFNCCRGVDGLSAGEWFLAGQINPVVGHDSGNAASASFTRTRGPSTLLLSLMDMFATIPRGVYTCQIPDSVNNIRTLYIGVDTIGGC